MNPFTIAGDHFNWYAYYQGRKYRFRTLAEATSFLAHAPTLSAVVLERFPSFEVTAEERERYAFATHTEDFDAEARQWAMVDEATQR